MKIDFLSENISAALPLLGKLSPATSQIPILGSVSIETKQDHIVFSATDLEFAVSFKIQGKIEKEGGVLVPGRQFVELVSSLGRERVGLTQEKDQLIAETQNGEYRFQVLPREEFPKLYEDKGEEVGKYSPQELTTTFEKMTFAVSQDESRPHLTGVYIVAKEGNIEYVATDGFRLSLKRVKKSAVAERLKEGLIVPLRLIQEALFLKSPDNMKLNVYDKGNQAIFETVNTILVGRLIEGKYPDYEKVIPKNSVTSVKLDREEFTRILKTVSVFAKESANVIGLSFSNGLVSLKSGTSSVGDAQAKMEGTQEGEDNNISFNVRFIQDFLKVSEGKHVVVKVNSPQEPAIFQSDEDPEFTHVIMPVRVQE